MFEELSLLKILCSFAFIGGLLYAFKIVIKKIKGGKTINNNVKNIGINSSMNVTINNVKDIKREQNHDRK